MEGPATCPACGGSLASWRTVAASDPTFGDRGFELQRCVRCGTAVTAGAAPANMYDTGSYGHDAPRLYGAARPLLSVFDRQRLALVRALARPPARLLDAGAGRGRFVAHALAAGYDAFGIEPSARGAGAAGERGVPVRRTTIEEAEIPASSVDVISVWHVLEHLDDPGTALDRIRSWLRPRGGVLIGVPNLDSFQARLAGERWYHLDVPRHRVHFTLLGLRALLRAEGFEVVRTRQVLLEHNPFGMWQSLVSRLTRHPSYAYNLLKRNAPLRSPDLMVSLGALPLLAPAAALELLAGLTGRGGTVAVLARPE